MKTIALEQVLPTLEVDPVPIRMCRVVVHMQQYKCCPSLNHFQSFVLSPFSWLSKTLLFVYCVLVAETYVTRRLPLSYLTYDAVFTRPFKYDLRNKTLSLCLNS